MQIVVETGRNPVRLNNVARFLSILLVSHAAIADEPLKPIPLNVEYDRPKALLGKRLFFDKRLSLTNEVACGSCHDPKYGMSDGQSVATGVKGRKGTINTPTVYNAFFNFRQFWNGRAEDLKAQASGPLHNPIEMAMSKELVEERLRANREYRELFDSIYGNDEPTFRQVIDAIVEFEKALFTPNAKFDRYLRGTAVLTDQESRGYMQFKSFGCISCHNGVNVGGNSYQYLGAVNPMESDVKAGDRYEITKDPFDRNRFKVPSLRNIELTGPYLHDGSKTTLEETLHVMAFHNLGFRLDKDQISDIIAFLKTLTGEKPAILEQQ